MSSSHYAALKRQFAETPVLIVDADRQECRLVDRAEATRILMDGELETATAINVEAALQRFALLAGIGDRAFRIADIAEIAGISHSRADHWVRAEPAVITPSIQAGQGAGRGDRKFSWADAFAAGCCGSMRRQGFGRVMLRRVFDTITDAAREPAAVTA